MTNKDLFYAMDGLDASFVMKAAPGEKLNKSNNAWLKWFSIAACFWLLITTFVIIPILNDEGSVMVNNVLPTDIENIIWNENIGSDGSASSVENLEKWNGFTVDVALYEVLQTCSSNKYIAIIITKANGEIVSQSEYTDILDESINRDYKNNTLYLFATKDQISNWKIDNKEYYVFYLANQSDYEN